MKGLENTEFTITIVEGNANTIPLVDGQSFSYLMDDHEDELVFSFTIPEINAATFNLVSPIGDLLLIVNNGKNEPSYDEDQVSREGFISFTKKEVK